MSTKKIQITTPIVTSVNGKTGDVTIDTSGGSGTTQMKKLTFTGGATGEYDGSSDVSIEVPDDKFYVLQIGEDANKDQIFTNNYDEAKAAYESGKMLVAASDEGFLLSLTLPSSFKTSSVDFLVNFGETLYLYTWHKETKKLDIEVFSVPIYDYQDGLTSSGAAYWDKDKSQWTIKDTSYKAGNGISIADDGTISVTTATYYSGTSTPANTLGADGDLYLQTEG